MTTRPGSQTALADTESSEVAGSPRITPNQASKHAPLDLVVLWFQRLVPLAIGAPVVAGVVVTLRHLASTRYPFLGWGSVIASDGKAFSLGHLPYGDPRAGYTGMFYTPLYPMLLAPLYRVLWWDGWPIVLTLVSGVLLAGTAGWLATGPRRAAGPVDRFGDVLAGIGIGGVAWWIVSANPNNMLFDAGSDQTAVMFALLGLVSLAVHVARRSSRVWPTVALLTAALWTKQTTAVAVAAAVVAIAWWTIRGVVARRTAFHLALALVVANFAILGFLQIVSHGWAWFFIIEMPSQTVQRDPAVLVYVRELRNLLILPLALVAVCGASWLAGRIHRRGSPVRWLRSVGADAKSVLRRPAAMVERSAPPMTSAAVLVLTIFLVFAVPVSFAARRKTGANPNQWLGVLWATTFLFAIAYAAARRTRAGAATSAVTMIALVATVHVGTIRDFAERRGLTVPSTYPAVDFATAPFSRREAGRPDLRVYAKSHRVYHPAAGDLNDQSFKELWPAQPDLVDLLAAGEHPSYLIDALLHRRFDAVAPFVRNSPFFLADRYVSAFGRTEENFLWKLNRVISSGYTASLPGTPAGFLGRRPGPALEPWLATCFGPFDVANAEWEIHAGGGLWCREDGSDVLRLEQTPARVTEIRTASAVRPRGAIVVGLRTGMGAVNLRFGVGSKATAVRIEPGTSRGLLVVQITSGANGRTRTQIVDAEQVGGGPSVTLALDVTVTGPGRVTVPVDSHVPAVVDVSATAESRAVIDLSAFTAG